MVKQPLELVLLGGTGFVGNAILRQVQCMQPGSVKVHMLVRRDDMRINHPFITVFKGDLSSIPLALFPENPHIVIHFATKNIDSDGSGFGINALGTQKLMEVLPVSTMGIIYGSSMSVYGQSSQESINEEYLVNPQTPLAKSRRWAEEIILGEMGARRKNALVLRPRFVLGKGDKYTVPRLSKLFQYGIKIGKGRQGFSIIDVDDYAKIIIQLSRRIDKRTSMGMPLCVPLNIGYKRQINFCEIQEIICRLLGLEQPKWKIPVADWLLQVLRFAPSCHLRGIVTMLELIGYSHFADVSNLIDEIGEELPARNPLDVFHNIVQAYIEQRGVINE